MFSGAGQVRANFEIRHLNFDWIAASVDFPMLGFRDLGERAGTVGNLADCSFA